MHLDERSEIKTWKRHLHRAYVLDLVQPCDARNQDLLHSESQCPILKIPQH